MVSASKVEFAPAMVAMPVWYIEVIAGSYNQPDVVFAGAQVCVCGAVWINGGKDYEA